MNKTGLPCNFKVRRKNLLCIQQIDSLGKMTYLRLYRKLKNQLKNSNRPDSEILALLKFGACQPVGFGQLLMGLFA